MDIESFVLSTFASGLVGIARSTLIENKEIIVTTLSSVQIFDIDTQVCSKSWHQKSDSFFSLPAVEHAPSKRLIAVANGKTLFSWPFTEASFSKAQRFSCPSESIAVFADDALVGALAVYRNGTVILHDAATLAEKASKQIFEQGTANILSAVCVPHSPTSVLLLLCIRSRAGEETLSVFLTSSSSKDLLRPVASFPIEHPNKSEPASPKPSYLSLSVVPTSPLTCSILWSDATVDLHRLSIPSGTSDEASLEHTRSFKLACYDLPPRKARSKTSSRSSEEPAPVHMAAAGQFLLLAGVAAENPKPKLLTVWDHATGICVHTHKLAEPESGQDDLSSTLPKDNAIVQIVSSSASASSEFFVAGSRTVWVCPSLIPDRSLSLSLGKAKLTASLLAPPSAATLTDSSNSLVINLKDVVNGAVLKRSSTDVMSKCEALCTAALANDAELLGLLDDCAGRQAEAAFLPKLRAFLAAHAPQVRGQSIVRSQRLPKVLISQHVLKQLVTACLERSWTAAMGMLLHTRLVSSSSCPELIPTILQKNNMELLEAVLTRVYDISEANLVRIIRHLLSMKDQAPVTAFLDAKRRSGRFFGAIPAFPKDTPIEGFLRLVICAPRNDIFLTSSLRSLTFRELQLFLSFLGKWLHRYAMCLDLRLNFQTLLRVPTLNQIAQWISAVVDAHYTTLVTSEELQPLLRRIIDDAAAELHFCSSMQGLLPVQALSKLDASKLPKAAVGEYSIEVVTL